MSEKNDFLEKLALLSQEYNATFGYTTDDDGIHIELDRVEVFRGFLDSGDVPTRLRESK